MLVFVKRRPNSPDSILDLGCLELLRCVTICPRYLVLSSLVNISTLMLSIYISTLLLELWLLRISVFPGCILNPTFSELCVEFTHHFLKLLLCSCKQEHIVSKSQICEATRTPKHMPIPFFFCQRGRSSLKATCSSVLKSKLDGGSPCIVPFLISNMSLSLSVIMFDTTNFEGVPKKALCLMESTAFVKSIVAIHILTPYSWHFCSIILYVAK